MDRKDFIKTSLLGLFAMTNLSALRKFTDELPEQDTRMPVLFVGHGSPMNAIEDNGFSRYWAQLATEIPQPKAVLVVSAHWLTRGTFVTAMEKPRTIHDFGGFPQALFEVQYPAPGHPALANEIRSMVRSTSVDLDHDWGLDHGAWSIVKNMYPKADIPVLQLSIDYYKGPQYHYDLARELAALRKKGVLILGSGNMVHNLRLVAWDKPQDFVYDWALEMDTRFKALIGQRDHAALIAYEKLGAAAKLAVPTPDHYYPLLYTLGLQEKDEDAVFFNDKTLMGSLSMTSVKIRKV